MGGTSHIEGDDDGPRVVGPLAVVARAVTKVAVRRAACAAFVARHHVGRHVQVGQLSGRVKVQVGALQRGVRVRRPVVILHGVVVRLRTPVPVLPIGREPVGADNARAAVLELVVPIGVIDDVPVAACVDPIT